MTKTLTPACVLPDWMFELTFQQQSVLILALRGPDGIAKNHPMKDVQRAYRGSVLKAAAYGRLLEFDETAYTFMSMEFFANGQNWREIVWRYFQHIDELPHHFHNHLMHGAQILGYKHPDERYRDRWGHFYDKCCNDAHLEPESVQKMDLRLADWGRENWDEERR